jgi:steroid delta-isomerase-like uncharacterized protein
MTNRRHAIAALLGAVAFAQSVRAAGASGPAECGDGASVAGALVDRYAAAVNAHDTSAFPSIFTDAYVQHSGRSPSGLAAQIENFRRIFTSMPDVRMHVDDRIIAGDRVVARNTFTATNTQPIRGIPPTGKAFAFHTIDIWRVENGKLAEHWDLTDTLEVLRELQGV